MLQILLLQNMNSRSNLQRLKICMCLQSIVKQLGNNILFFKDNDKLLEEPVNHMAANTLRSDGVCVKLVTKPGESLPGVYVEDRDRQLLQQIPLDDGFESHFDGVCQECEP